MNWDDVKGGMSGLVVIFDSTIPLKTVTIQDGAGNVLDRVELGEEKFVIRQFRLPPGDYKVQLPTEGLAARALDIQTKDGDLTYLQFSPLDLPGGIEIKSWTQVPTDMIKGVIESLVTSGKGNLILPADVSPSNNVLQFNTDPPWPIEPPKTK